MPTIALDTETHDKLQLVAATLGVTAAEAVAELLRRLSLSAANVNAAPTSNGQVPVHVVYKGQRVEAAFDPRTHRVTITNGALAGKSFNSPSRAAIEVVSNLNPSVHPNRNGWGFWLVTSTGKELQTIR